MNLVADEGIDGPIVTRLRAEGHRVWYVAEMAPGIADSEVLQIANDENAILLTFDKDFGDLVFRQGLVTQGVILLRLHGLSPMQKADLIARIIDTYSDELKFAFSVITKTRIRIRPR